MGQAVSDLWATRQADGLSESHDLTGGSALAEAYLCNWGDRAAYRALLLGTAPSDTAAYPNYACRNVRVEPRGWTEGQPYPAKALLTASYQDDTASLSPQTSDLSKWLEHWEAGGEAVTVGPGYHWASAPKDSIEKAGVSAVKIVPQATITLTGTTGVDSDTKELLFGAQGKVNKAAVTLKGYPYGIAKLLCTGADLNETGVSDASGRSLYNVSLKLAAFYDHTWNQFWRDDPAWCKVPHAPVWDSLSDADGNGPYLLAPFSDLDPANW